MNPSSASPRNGLSVRHSLLATARPVSRKWKRFLSILKGKKSPSEQHRTTTTTATNINTTITTLSPSPSPKFDGAGTPEGIRRRHSSDELKRTYDFPYFTSITPGVDPNGADNSFLSSPMPLSASSSTPAGPVSSALSPPPRRAMMAKRASCLPTTSLPPPPSLQKEDPRRRRSIIQSTTLNSLRLSIDVEQNHQQHRHSSGDRASPTATTISTSSGDDLATSISRPITPYRSGTLGGGGFLSRHASYSPPPLPDLPLPIITASNTASSSSSSSTPLKERRKRRSPMSIPDDLTLDLQGASSINSSSGTSSTTAEREKAMQALEGKAGPNSLEQDKAQYEAVVSGSSTSTSSSATYSRRRNGRGEDSPPYSSSSQSTRVILTPPPYYPSTPSSAITMVGLRDEVHEKRPISTIDEQGLNLYIS
ncbi:hypothetical protein BX666DRAFT_1875608 [Dichotomocladium elegans]|nr:hypothetical protein BX666DRAFT_1875608 [Dichotomocladium elegans]